MLSDVIGVPTGDSHFRYFSQPVIFQTCQQVVVGFLQQRQRLCVRRRRKQFGMIIERGGDGITPSGTAIPSPVDHFATRRHDQQSPQIITCFHGGIGFRGSFATQHRQHALGRVIGAVNRIAIGVEPGLSEPDQPWEISPPQDFRRS